MGWLSFFTGYMTGAISVAVAVVIAFIIHGGSLDDSSYVFDDEDEMAGGRDERK